MAEPHKAKCYSCGKYFDSDKDDWFSVHKHHDIHSWIVCSPSCLVELAWEQKEAQQKISKSKEGSTDDLQTLPSPRERS